MFEDWLYYYTYPYCTTYEYISTGNVCAVYSLLITHHICGILLVHPALVRNYRLAFFGISLVRMDGTSNRTEHSLRISSWFIDGISGKGDFNFFLLASAPSPLRPEKEKIASRYYPSRPKKSPQRSHWLKKK